MGSKAVRWSREQIDAYVARRKEAIDKEIEDARLARWAKRVYDLPSPPQKLYPVLKPAPLLYPLVLLCEAHGLPRPRPEYAFHPTRGWRFDYAFISEKIAVEIDGGAWISGRHNRGAGFIEDQRKRNAAELLGWHVLNYTPDRLGEAINDLKAIFK